MLDDTRRAGEREKRQRRLIAGAAASGIQAAVNGATPVQALEAAAIGGAIGGATAGVGFEVSPYVSSLIATPLVQAGVASPATAQAVGDAVLLSGGLAQAGYGASRGDYTGAIGLGVSIGLVEAFGAQPAGADSGQQYATDTSTLSDANNDVRVNTPPGGGFLETVGTVAGAIWSLPNTAVGLIYGGLGYGVGWLLGTNPGIGFAYGQIQFTNNPFTSTAITLGDVGIYGTGPTYQPTAFVPGTAFQNQFEEYQHTLQGRVLGPFYLPAQLIFGGVGTLYGYATGATSFVEAWHSAANLLEVGPHSTNPRPWWW